VRDAHGVELVDEAVKQLPEAHGARTGAFGQARRKSSSPKTILNKAKETSALEYSG